MSKHLNFSVSSFSAQQSRIRNRRVGDSLMAFDVALNTIHEAHEPARKERQLILGDNLARPVLVSSGRSALLELPGSLRRPY